MSYNCKEKLVTIPLCHWREYSDIVYLLFKRITTNSSSNAKIKKRVRETRTSTKGVLLDVPKCKTAAFQDSCYIRAASVRNTLPCCITDTTKTLVSFETSLKHHYKVCSKILKIRNYKSVCVKCHSTRSPFSMSTQTCC